MSNPNFTYISLQHNPPFFAYTVYTLTHVHAIVLPKPLSPIKERGGGGGGGCSSLERIKADVAPYHVLGVMETGSFNVC